MESGTPFEYDDEGVLQYRFGGSVPVPYRPGYRGPIYGQAPQMFGRMFANRTGLGSIPMAGPMMQNMATRGFTRLGQFGQRIPGGRRIGNLLNRIARPVNRATGFQDRMNPRNMMMGGLRGLFGGSPFRRGQGRGGFFRNRMTLNPYEKAERLRTAGPIGPGGGLDSYGFGQSIQRPDAAGIAAGVNRQVIESLPFEQIDITDPTGDYYQLRDKATGNIFLQGRQHKDYRPRGPSLQRIGGGM